jgi:ectoine hydroxylase-related dioxygenase (phytanoyl-CoA dioxygenase family)
MERAEQHLERLARDGYTIVEDAFEADLGAALLADIDRLERELATQPANNSFEGHHTTRVYNLLAHGELWQQVPVQPAVLPIVRNVLGDGCLISSLSSISIHPGETAQPIHADDQIMPLARPHPATVANSMWALTDFTEANGATRVVPGSHLADHAPPYGEHQDTVPAEMAAGSILIWHGSLWHGGGANLTDHRRVGVAMNYCAGWIRQQENQQLGISAEVMAGFSPLLRELCGLGIYRGLIGHIDRQSPAHLLHGDSATVNVWDAVG